MAPTRPIELHQRRFRLTSEPAAAAEARGQVRAVIRAWKVPVDPDIAVLLTSDLVTSAIMHGNGETVTLVIRRTRGHLRIDVYDASRSLPVAADEPARSQVRAVIRAWKVPVDPDIAVLLTSDLVTSVIMHGNGETGGGPSVHAELERAAYATLGRELNRQRTNG